MGVHPHPLRVRLPLPARAFTPFSQLGNRSVTDSPRRAARVGTDHEQKEGLMRTTRLMPALLAAAALAFGVAACGSDNSNNGVPQTSNSGSSSDSGSKSAQL